MTTLICRFLSPTCLFLFALIAIQCCAPQVARAGGGTSDTVLYNAGGVGGVIVGDDGNFYGTIRDGGANNGGYVYQLKPGGSPTIIYSFGSKSYDGVGPSGTLIQGIDGNFYGATFAGGTQDSGTIYQVTPDGIETVLFNLGTSASDGSSPETALIQGSDGSFYGVTPDGGAYNHGTVFHYVLNGPYTTLYSFGSTDTDGVDPAAALVLGADGNFYGTTASGGADGGGTLFSVTPAGAVTELYSFGTEAGDGLSPEASLTLGSDGFLYGTTRNGGQGSDGTVFQVTSMNNVFSINTIHSFKSDGSEGYLPVAGLTEGSDGNFYGTASAGGAHDGDGTFYEVSPSGTFNLLYSFNAYPDDGIYPDTNLTLATDGYFYGVTLLGGSANIGVVYRIAAPIPTITSFSPAAAGAGATVTVTGVNLLFATGVSFNGTAATAFNSVSPTSITATVPVGATTGPITVTSTSGSAVSSTSFTFIHSPTITSFTPTAGLAGAAVTITGTNLTGASAVSFNGTAATKVVVVNSTTVKTLVPAGATPGPISLTTLGGTATSTASFTVYNKPTVTSFTPASGSIGASVTITGTNFTGATAVKFHTTSAPSYTVVSSTSITVTVPSGATSGTISVVGPAGTGVSTSSFTVIAPPSITSFTPASGYANTDVTITGTSFTGATSVTFNGTAATTFRVVSDTSIKALVPSGASTGKIAITKAIGMGTSATSFTVLTVPTITSFTPTSGAPGAAVTITGTNLTGTTSVTVNGTASTKIDVLSSTSVRFLVPTGATSGKISATTSGGTATSSGIFTVN